MTVFVDLPPTSGGGGGAGDASAANQVTSNSYLASIDSSLLPRTINIDEISVNDIYFGYAAAGSSAASAVWRVKHIVVSGTTTTTTYADGNTNFDNIWNNRLSLTYS
jgi:hypothetical protein